MQKIFFLLFFSSFFLTSIYAKTILISDIDDTIRQTNVLSKVESTRSILKATPAFSALANIYSHFEANFYYLSAAPICLIDHYAWIVETKLPLGPVYQRACNTSVLHSSNSTDYKFNLISRIIEQNLISHQEVTEVLLFGDNAQHDPEVYQKIKSQFKQLRILIYIRDIRVEATKVDEFLPINRLDGINYFLTEYDLLKIHDGSFDNLPINERDKIREDYISGQLYPKYLYLNLARRYEHELGLSDKDALRKAYISLISNLRY